VPAARIASIAFHGDRHTVRLRGGQLRAPVLLLAAKAELANNAWRVHQITYAMSAATIDGGDAVFAGEQRFVPAASGTWRVELALFRVTVTAHDALFGVRVGSRLVVTGPDGSHFDQHVPGSGAAAALTSLVRGNYLLRFTAAVLGATTQVRVSRNDNIDVRLVTPLDVAAVAAVVALLIAAAVYGAVRVARHDTEGG
jgi:uncharacterized membrane protein